MDLFEIEIERHAWDAFSCACGPSAAHLARDLRVLAHAESHAECGFDLGNCVTLADCVWECAPAVTAVALAGLAGGGISHHARGAFLRFLLGVIDDPGIGLSVPANRDVPTECLHLVRSAEWLLYAEIASTQDIGHASYAFEALVLIGADPHRLALMHREGAARFDPFLWQRLEAVAGRRDVYSWYPGRAAADSTAG